MNLKQNYMHLFMTTNQTKLKIINFNCGNGISLPSMAILPCLQHQGFQKACRSYAFSTVQVKLHVTKMFAQHVNFIALLNNSKRDQLAHHFTFIIHRSVATSQLFPWHVRWSGLPSWKYWRHNNKPQCHNSTSYHFMLHL